MEHSSHFESASKMSEVLQLLNLSITYVCLFNLKMAPSSQKVLNISPLKKTTGPFKMGKQSLLVPFENLGVENICLSCVAILEH